mmetsp:Transcript_26004/g.44372  ORF Transcript_26004/g.44372 Transcript_26004/m.44372 type:complete len:408 (-) Transcript_26004:61-1284(-)
MMRLPERNSFPNQIIRQIGSQHLWAKRLHQHFRVGLHRNNHTRCNRQTILHSIHTIEQRDLIFLQILVVRARQSLQRCHEPHRTSQCHTCLSSQQFQRIGILLLGHERTASGICIVHGNALEHIVNDQILRELTQMRQEQRMPHEKLHDKVAIAHAIKGVARDAIKSQLLGKKFAIHTEGIPRQRTASQRALISARNQLPQSLGIPRNRRHVRHQPMAETNRLRGLQVRVSCHENVNVLPRKLRRSRQQGSQILKDVPLGLDNPQSGIGRHLIVSAASRMQFPPQWTNEFRETTFVGRVNVLVARFEFEHSGGPFVVNFFKSGNNGGGFLGGEDANFFSRFGVGDGSADVLGPHAFIKSNTLIKLLHDRIRPSLESAAGSEESSAGSFLSSLFCHGNLIWVKVFQYF